MLNIPERLKNLLSKDQSYYAFVHSSISNVTDWISDNKTVFFPEYTDHSFTHLNEVLKTADSLIADESWGSLSPQDAAALIISVMLHDCALHLSEDGFYCLINNEFPIVESRYLAQEKEWRLLWLDFMA